MHVDLREEILNEIDSKLPPLVSREILSDTLGNLISRRSFANLDALGRGIGVKVKLGTGRNVAYPKRFAMEWLRKNLTIADNH